jgi:hypothetical protein
MYLIIFDLKTAGSHSVKSLLTNIPSIINVIYLFENCFIVESNKYADKISYEINSRIPKTCKYLLSEITENFDGLLPNKEMKFLSYSFTH